MAFPKMLTPRVSEREIMKDVLIVFVGCGVSGRTTSLTRLEELSGKRLEWNYAKFQIVFPWPVEAPKVEITARRLNAIWGPYVLTDEQLKGDDDVLNELQALQRADGVMCVVDSQIARREANKEALHYLRRCLERIDRPAETLPLVFQVNKRDLPNLLTLEQIRHDLSWPCCHYVLTSALNEKDVETALHVLLDSILT